MIIGKCREHSYVKRGQNTVFSIQLGFTGWVWFSIILFVSLLVFTVDSIGCWVSISVNVQKRYRVAQGELSQGFLREISLQYFFSVFGNWSNLSSLPETVKNPRGSAQALGICSWHKVSRYRHNRKTILQFCWPRSKVRNQWLKLSGIWSSNYNLQWT